MSAAELGENVVKCQHAHVIKYADLNCEEYAQEFSYITQISRNEQVWIDSFIQQVMCADNMPSEKYAEFSQIPNPKINVCAEILVSIYCQQKQKIDLMNTEFSLKFID